MGIGCKGIVAMDSLKIIGKLRFGVFVIIILMNHDEKCIGS